VQAGFIDQMIDALYSAADQEEQEALDAACRSSRLKPEGLQNTVIRSADGVERLMLELPWQLAPVPSP
jgi:hypothetical protein